LAKRPANLSSTVYIIVIFLGLVVGLAVGRWWALVVAIGLGVWITLDSTVDEVPAWFLGAGYAALAGVGIAAGIGVRKLAVRR
jgi:hypothetical protein